MFEKAKSTRRGYDSQLLPATCGATTTLSICRSGIVGFDRFDLEDVEPGAPDLFVAERFDQRRLVDYRAAAGVDEQTRSLS